MDFLSIFLKFLGGLGLFLFGIHTMSEGLQTAAGNRMRSFLEKGTKTPVRGVLTGMLVTALIQSSSGTTVLTVGLVNAGIISLRQAIGIIMGANVGTTITAYLIGFNLKEYSLPIIGVGVFMMLFAKGKFSKIGKVIFGFGLLFYGMDIMGQGMKPLRSSEFFVTTMANVESNSLLGVFIGSVFTAVVQSSSATIGVLQELANQGAISYSQAVPILFGDNIGTTITALLASIGTTAAARRAALTHSVFNLMGTAIFLPLFAVGIFGDYVQVISNFIIPGGWEALNVKMQIAQTHGVFNMTNTLIQLPFVGAIAAIVYKIIPKSDDEIPARPLYLEHRLLTNPSMALANAEREIHRMGDLALSAFRNSREFFYKEEKIKSRKVRYLEDIVDSLEKDITEFIINIPRTEINEELNTKIYNDLQVVGDLERISDHAMNILEISEYVYTHEVSFSEEALEGAREMFEIADSMVQDSLAAFKNNDKELARHTIVRDDEVDQMEKDLRKEHIKRLNEGTCLAGSNAGALYVNLLGNLERLADHAVNISEYVVGEK